jgi:replicative DNA helicase
MEERLIGLLMRHPTDIPAVRQILAVSDFRSEATRTLFAALLEMWDAGVPIDLVVMAEHLRRRDQLDIVGWYLKLAEVWTAGAGDEQSAIAAAKEISNGGRDLA